MKRDGNYLWERELCVECGARDAGGCIARDCVTVADDEDVSERETIPCPPPEPSPRPQRPGNGQVPGKTWACGSPMALPCERPTARPFPAVRP